MGSGIGKSVRRLDDAHLDVLDNYGLLSPQFLTTVTIPSRQPVLAVGGYSYGGGAGGATTQLAAYSSGWESIRQYLLYVFGQVSDRKWIRYELDITADVCASSIGDGALAPGGLSAPGGAVRKQMSITILGTQRVPWQVLTSDTPGKVNISQGGLVGTTPDSLLAWPGQATSQTTMGPIMQIVYDFINSVNRSLVVGPAHPIRLNVYVPQALEWGEPGAYASWVETRAEKELNTFIDLLRAASSETGIVLRMDPRQIQALAAMNATYTKALADSVQNCSSAQRDADVGVLRQKAVELESLQPTLQRLLQSGGGGAVRGTGLD